MLVFETNRFGKRRTIDIHNLPIERTMAHKMTAVDLHGALERLGVSDIDPRMGHQDLSLRYGAWLQEQSEQAA